MKRQAIIIGATGLVGQDLLKQLCALYETVTVIARRTPNAMLTNMVFYQLNDFKQLAQVMSSVSVTTQTDAFTCLGTTKRQAGSKAAFRDVDLDTNLTFAQCCQRVGIKRFYLLSAFGANAGSRLFYNRVKGELEEAIKAIAFDELCIFRPFLILGPRKGRPVEKIAQMTFRTCQLILPKHLPAHPIAAKRVAAAMVITAVSKHEQRRHQSDQMRGPTVSIIDNSQMLTMTASK